ncbi:hypothetical protein FB446DRAFT_79299 [Lentinula raphanica]|nr:hypothetical protein C8R42DRAFT_722764 [Lentinula raphanica]KAJ3771906.1 hypothetical protein FB446DRAFT_79299 [Lentinula raphanica]
MASKKDNKAFPLKDVLRDLALLRVSEVKLASLVPPSVQPPFSLNGEVESDLEKSYQFTKEARATIKLRHAGKVEEAALGLETVRSGLEDFVKGLEGEKE